MARFCFTANEVLAIVKANVAMPERVKQASAEGNGIRLTVDTGTFLGCIEARISFAGFRNGVVDFEIKTGKLVSLFRKLVAMPSGKWFKIEGSKAMVDINGMLSERVKGIRVSDISSNSDGFEITTAEVSDVSGRQR